MEYEVPRTYEYPGVPDHLMSGIQLWVEHGLKPGTFLQAIFANDLFRAVQLASDESLKALKPLVNFIYQYLPGGCWGPDALKTWKGTKRS